MGKDGIDASIGLAFSLELLRRYKQNGVLQATIPRIPGLNGSCRAFIQLTYGEPGSIFVEDANGQRHSSDRETLSRLDKERGPYEWKLLSHTGISDHLQFTAPVFASHQSSPTSESSATAQRPPKLKVISGFPWDQFSALPPEQLNTLFTIFTIIDEECTIDDIKGMIPLPPEEVEALVHTLLERHVIGISTD